jgi:hypothetical protein
VIVLRVGETSRCTQGRIEVSLVIFEACVSVDTVVQRRTDRATEFGRTIKTRLGRRRIILVVAVGCGNEDVEVVSVPALVRRCTAGD